MATFGGNQKRDEKKRDPFSVPKGLRPATEKREKRSESQTLPSGDDAGNESSGGNSQKSWRPCRSRLILIDQEKKQSEEKKISVKSGPDRRTRKDSRGPSPALFGKENQDFSQLAIVTSFEGAGKLGRTRIPLSSGRGVITKEREGNPLKSGVCGFVAEASVLQKRI